MPDSCPFTILEIKSSDNTSLNAWLIREHDQYGEFPHIYARICGSTTQERGTQELKVIILSDTGCGTEVSNATTSPAAASCGGEIGEAFNNIQLEPEVWNIRTFLEYTINPGGKIPYLVITTHCHYDHILGIEKLPSTAGAALGPQDADHRIQKPYPSFSTTVLSSAKGQQFVTPYEALQKHSLCSDIGIQAPHYEVGTWAYDFYRVVYKCPKSWGLKPPYDHILTPYTIIHTLGHTPDSLSWYDADLRLICVGDHFYLRQSEHTKSAPWGPEAPMPTIFNLESDFEQWWGALGKLLGFVREENKGFVGKFSGKAGVEGIGDEKFEVPSQDPFFENRDMRLDTHKDKTQQQSALPGHIIPQPTTCIASYADSDADARISVGFQHASYAPGSIPANSRVKLAASHTTLGIDAETAILEMKEFAAAVLRDEVPNMKVADGRRGEQRLLWDYSLRTNETGKEEIRSISKASGEANAKGRFSILAPIKIVEEGRRRINRAEWEVDSRQ